MTAHNAHSTTPASTSVNQCPDPSSATTTAPLNSQIRQQLLNIKGIINARVVELDHPSNGQLKRRVAYIVSQNGINDSAAAHGSTLAMQRNIATLKEAFALVAIVEVSQIDDPLALSKLPLWTDTALQQAQQQLAQLAAGADCTVQLQRPASTVSVLVDDLVTQQVKVEHPADPLTTDATDATATWQTNDRVGEISDKPAIIDGGPLRQNENDPLTLDQALIRSEQGQGWLAIATCQTNASTEQAIAPADYQISYQQIGQTARLMLGRIQRLGVQPGAIIIVDCSDISQYVTAIWACLLGGFVPVPFALPTTFAADQWTRFNQVNTLLKPQVLLHSQPMAFIDQQTAHLDGIPFCLAISDLTAPKITNDEPLGIPISQQDPQAPALIFMTSGSTGTPKAVVQTHQAMLAMVAGFGQHQLQLNHTDIMFNWMPVDHVGALGFLILCPIIINANQVHAKTADILAAPEKWLDIISQYRVTATWAPNFAFKQIRQASEKANGRWDLNRWDLNSVRKIINGGEAVLEQQLLDFIQTFAPFGLKQQDVMIPSFGMSETCSGFTVGTLHQQRDGHTCLGAPSPGNSIRIVNDQGQMLREGEIGHVQLSGRQLFSHYFAIEQASKDDQGWFDCGDIGFVANNQLYLTGREKDIIIINGANILAHDIEVCAAKVLGVDSRLIVALAFRQANATTDQIAILFACDQTDYLADNELLTTLVLGIKNRVLNGLGLVVSQCIPLAPAAFPRTSIGKINRSALTQQFNRGDFNATFNAAYNATFNAFFNARETRLEPGQPGQPGQDRRAIALHQLISKPMPQLDEQTMSHHDHLVITAVAKHHQQQALLDLNEPATGIVYFDPDLASDSNEYYPALFNLAQALSTVAEQQRPSHVFAVQRQAVVSPDQQAKLTAAIASLSLIMAPLQWHLMAVPTATASTELAAIAAQGIAEPLIMITPQGPQVRRFDPVVLSKPSAPLNFTGLWVVAGGLGGIGRLVCQWLLTHKATVIALGRRPISALDESSHQALQQLSRQGDFIYQSADITDAKAVNNAVRQIQAQRQLPLAGILQLAGSGELLSFDAETSQTPATLSHTLIQGAQNLTALLTDQPQARMVVIGSIVAAVGARINYYGVAHGALYQWLQAASRDFPQIAYLGLSSVLDVGLSQGRTNEVLLANDGLLAIDPEALLLTLEGLLLRPGSHWFMGLDGDHPYHARLMNTPPRTQRAVGWIADAQNLHSEGVLSVNDALGHPTAMIIRPIQQIPRDSHGLVDVSALLAIDSAEQQPPANPLEQLVADTMAEVLAQSVTSRSANFFRLGGSSVNAAQLASQLSELLFIDLPSTVIFQSPTVQGIASALQDREPQPGLIDAIIKHLDAMMAETSASNDTQTTVTE